MEMTVKRSARGALVAVIAALAVACEDGATRSVPATALRIGDIPADIVAGESFDLEVELTDDKGARSTETGRLVSITLTAGGKLSGPVTVSANAGVARFNELAITSAGDAFRLEAASGSVTATTAEFAVNVGPPSATRSSIFPDSIQFVFGAPTPIEFTFTDAYGNPISQKTVSITSSLAGVSFEPAVGTTGANGLFTTTVTATASGKATLSATIGGSSIALDQQLATTELCASLPFGVPGSVTGSIPIPLCDAAGRPAAVYKFTKSGSGGVSFSAHPTGFTASVEVKTSLLEPSVALQPTAQIPNAEWLLPDGTYLYRISSQSATGGSYSITSTPIAGNTGVTARFFAAPGTYTGQTLALSDRDFGDNTRYDYFIVYSTRSCTITMRSTAFDAFLWIDDPVNIVDVDGDNDSGGGTDARVVMDRCSTSGNPIGILANSNNGPNGTIPTGPYTLIIEFGPPPPSLRGSLLDSAPKPLVALAPGAAQRDLTEAIRFKRASARRR